MSSVHYNLPKRIENELALMAEKYNISKITLFGSRARGDNTDKSDVDIAVYGCEDFARFSLDVEDEVWTLLKFDIIKEAYSIYDFLEEDIWLEMLENRNDLAHIYDGGKARKLADIIISKYVPEFMKMENALNDRYGEVLDNI